jgi:hypothetical protein
VNRYDVIVIGGGTHGEPKKYQRHGASAAQSQALGERIEGKTWRI